MASETSKRMYCSECKDVTEHIKISYADVQALKDINEDYFRKHPDDFRASINKAYPEWLKNTTFGTLAVASEIFNGVSNYFLGKDYSSLWICSHCKRHQSRMFE